MCPPPVFITLIYGKSRNCGATSLLNAANRAVSLSLIPGTTSSGCVSTVFNIAANSFVLITAGGIPAGCVLEGYTESGCLGDSVQVNVANSVGVCKSVTKGKSFEMFC